MNLKEILGKIKATLGADAPAEIITLLADADRQLQDLTESKRAADRESAERKEKIRELEGKIAETEGKLSQVNTPEAKAELDRLKKVEADHLALLKSQDDAVMAEWAEKSKLLSVDATDKRYAKVQAVKKHFVIPKEGETLNIEQVRENLKTYAHYDDIGHFNVESTDTGGAPPKPTDGAPKPGTILGYVQNIKTFQPLM